MNLQKFLIIGVSLLIALTAFSCAGSGDNIVSSPLNEAQVSTGGIKSEGGGRHLWGWWKVTIDPISGSCQVIPLRGCAFTANVNKLLESKPGNLLITNIDTSQYLTEGRLDCTVTLKHPFPGLEQYNGFDVWGVFMHNGTTQLGYDDLTYSGGPNAGQNEAVLLNPDGYTRWFNQPEFDGNGSPLLEYWPGKLGNLPFPTATLNPYKAFADGLGPTDNFYDWILAGNANNRCIFRAGSANSRRYQLDFPIISGQPKLEFQYAVIATWEPGDPTKTGNPATYDPFDFPSSANCEEPFLLKVTTDESTLYNDGTSSGGDFVGRIEVFDWQGGSVGHTGVPNEVHSIIVIGDFVPGGSHQFTQAELIPLAEPASENSSVFQVEITNCAPSKSGTADFWVVVEAGGLNGASYYQGFPTAYPSGARRASFIPGKVAVSSEAPWPDVIYVDDSNTSGIEDGTHAHPYNTIQEGIDNNPLLKEIWVDDSGNPYIEHVKMKSGTILKSVNWDPSDGTNRAFIDGPDTTGAHSVEFPSVNNASLEGFKIGTCGSAEDDISTEMILVTGGSNNLIKDCLFTGKSDIIQLSAVRATDTSNLTIQNCRFDGIDRDIDQHGCLYFRIIRASNSPGLKVLNNIFTNLRPTEDEASKNGWITLVENTDNVTFKNNLVHHVVPLAGVGGMGAVLLEGFSFKSCTNLTLINNTIDYLDVTHAFFIQQVFGYRFDTCSGVTFKNNIVTRLYCNGFPPPLARGVMAYNTTVICDYTDVYDIGPGSNGTPYWGGASAGAGAISANPLYINPDAEEYDLSPVSPAQQGDPSIVDWDDTGSPSNNPSDPNPNTRSRMGCHGGPDGQFVGLLTP